MGCDPELDTSPELDPDAGSYYVMIVSILRWMIEIGRIDMITKVSLLSFHAALLREGHLAVTMHVMVHVGHRYNFRLVYDSLHPQIDYCVFKKCDWLEFIAMSRRQYPLMHQNHKVRKSISACL